MRKYALVLVFFCCFRSVISQDLRLQGISSNFIQSGQFSSKWSYNIHVLSVYNAKQLSVGDKVFPNGPCHFIPQFAVNRKFSHGIQSGMGIALSKHNIFGIKENEPRLFLQSSYVHPLSKLKLSHRARLEFRYPKNLVTKIRDNAQIGRYALGLNYPLGKKANKGVYLAASNESFLYFKGATNGPVSSRNGTILSENWSTLAVGYQLRQHKMEVGYGYQVLVRNKKQEYRYFELLQITYQRAVNWENFEMWWYQ